MGLNLGSEGTTTLVKNYCCPRRPCRGAPNGFQEQGPYLSYLRRLGQRFWSMLSHWTEAVN